MNPQRLVRAALCAALVTTAPAWADVPAGDLARLSTQYSNWAGSKANADALVSGLTRGGSITLVTTGPDGTSSLAGFTPAAPMSYGEVRAALASAQQSLSRLGVSRPTADQIQTALIGGDLALPNGGSRQVAGAIGTRASVASR